MVITEKEAAEKWCPMVHVAMATIGAETRRISNRGDDHEMMVCIGSLCMAWRWTKTNVRFEDLSEEDRRFALTPSPGDLVPAWRTYGYCGAFGKVEP